MSTPLHVLILEDCPADAELMVHELRQAEFEPDWVLVETEEDYLAHLDPAPDVILADYTLPGWEAVRALNLLQERGLDIPFIIVSGTIGEELAVECLKRGVADYLLKDRLARLGEAVRHALQEKKLRDERQQAHAALQESEEKYRDLVERSNDGIVIIQDDIIQYANPRVAEMWGGTPEEMIGTPLVDYIYPDDRPKLFDLYRRRIADEKFPSVYEAVLRRRDGSRYYAELNAGLITYRGRPADLAMVHDITERVRAEEKLRLAKLVVENSPTVLIRWTADEGKGWPIDFVSENVAQFGYSPGELLSGAVPYASIVHPDDLGRMSREVSGYVESGCERYRQEYRIVTRDGEARWVDDQTTVVRDAGGRVTHYQGVLTDITERVQAREALQRQADQLEALRQVSLDITAELELDALLQSIVERAIGLLDAEAGGMYLYRPERDVLVWTVTVGPGMAHIGTELRLGEGLSGKVWETGEPIIVDDYRHWEGHAAIYEGRPWTAVLGVPITWGGELLGVIDLMSDAEVRTFTPDDARLLSQFADQAATAIQNARLFEQTQRHLESLTNLNRASQVITSSLDLQKVLEQIVELAGSVVRSEYSSVVLPDEKGEAVMGVEDFRGVAPIAQRIRSSGTAHHVMESGQPIVVDDIAEDGTTSPPLRRPDGELIKANPAIVAAGICSFAAVPIRGREGTLGVLLVRSREPHAFHDQLALLTAFANQAAVAIGNARLYRRLEELARGLEKTVLERTTELRRSKERVEAILDSSPDAILLLQPDGTIEAGNLAFGELFGYHIDEVYDQPPTNLVEPGHAQALSDALRATMDKGEPERLEVIARHKDGTTFDADAALAPIRGEGSMIGLVCSLRDISALKEAERMKDAFVSNVSHELRTPITSLKIYHGLLREALPHRRGEYLDAVRRETERLALIIEDLLRLSRLDQGRVTLILAPVDLNALADQYVADRAPLAEERGLSLTLDAEPGLPPVRADEGLLGQALSVLLTNALNYTPAGGRVVVSTRACELEGKPCVGFSVGDTGPGILPEEQPYLFQRFFRGKAGHESGQPGTGLGLAIAKEIVGRHYGRIEVVSQGVPGEGATFNVWLPVGDEHLPPHDGT
jgi:PAS domain S-box-containing protein